MNKFTIILIILLVCVIGYAGYNTFFTKQTTQFYENCCLVNYNGILFYNDCVSEKCFYGTQIGWSCKFKENTTENNIPVKLMNCTK